MKTCRDCGIIVWIWTKITVLFWTLILHGSSMTFITHACRMLSVHDINQIETERECCSWTEQRCSTFQYVRSYLRGFLQIWESEAEDINFLKQLQYFWLRKQFLFSVTFFNTVDTACCKIKPYDIDHWGKFRALTNGNGIDDSLHFSYLHLRGNVQSNDRHCQHLYNSVMRAKKRLDLIDLNLDTSVDNLK